MSTPNPTPERAAAPLRCRGCRSQDPRRVLDLGSQPASDDFPTPESPGPDARWPLELWWCPRCTLAQLGPVRALLEEPVLAVESATSRRHARATVATVLQEHPGLVGRTVREFASHHGGSWLPALAEAGCRPVPGGPADLVVDTHALAHEEDVHARLADRAAALAPGGLLILEFHHLLPLLEQGQFDTVRHGHWSYLSLSALERLAGAHGLQVLAAAGSDVFGGSLRVTMARTADSLPRQACVEVTRLAEQTAGLVDGTGFRSLADRVEVTMAALRRFLHEQQEAGRTVLGYGAPSKAAVLLGVAGVDRTLLDFTVDAAPLKHGLSIPGPRIPIRPVAELHRARPDVVLILTWDIADEVVAQLEHDGGWGAEYWVPLPVPTRRFPDTGLGASGHAEPERERP